MSGPLAQRVVGIHAGAKSIRFSGATGCIRAFPMLTVVSASDFIFYKKCSAPKRGCPDLQKF